MPSTGSKHNRSTEGIAALLYWQNCNIYIIFLLRAAEFWLCSQALCEVQEAAPWASWHLGDSCATRVILCQFFRCLLCFCFAGFAVLAVKAHRYQSWEGRRHTHTPETGSVQSCCVDVPSTQGAPLWGASLLFSLVQALPKVWGGCVDRLWYKQPSRHGSCRGNEVPWGKSL